MFKGVLVLLTVVAHATAIMDAAQVGPQSVVLWRHHFIPTAAHHITRFDEIFKSDKHKPVVPGRLSCARRSHASPRSSRPAFVLPVLGTYGSAGYPSSVGPCVEHVLKSTRTSYRHQAPVDLNSGDTGQSESGDRSCLRNRDSTHPPVDHQIFQTENRIQPANRSQSGRSDCVAWGIEVREPQRL